MDVSVSEGDVYNDQWLKKQKVLLDEFKNDVENFFDGEADLILELISHIDGSADRGLVDQCKKVLDRFDEIAQKCHDAGVKISEVGYDLIDGYNFRQGQVVSALTLLEKVEEDNGNIQQNVNDMLDESNVAGVDSSKSFVCAYFWLFMLCVFWLFGYVCKY